MNGAGLTGCRKTQRQLFDVGCMNDLSTLMLSMQYSFDNIKLLERALTHPSYSEKNNQRLEFLGDAVLGYLMSDVLFRMKPRLSEGVMTRMRASLIREATLFEVAQSISLGNYIRMSAECERNGGRNRSSIISDAMEALIAAVYLDGGMEKASALVSTLWADQLSQASDTSDSKSVLQEKLQAMGREAPTYRTLSEDGPPHQRIYQVAVYAEGCELARGSGSSKKRAEQEAAKLVLKKFASLVKFDEAEEG